MSQDPLMDEVTPLQAPVWVDGVTPLNSVNMTQLQTRDEKGAPSGYVPLDASGYINIAGQIRSASDVFARIGAPGQVWLTNGSANGGAIFFGSAADTNLYRYAANGLATDGYFRAGQNVITAQGTAQQVAMGNYGSLASLVFGSAADTNLYRSAATVLKTDGYFVSLLGMETWGAAATSEAFAAKVPGDTAQRFYVQTDGKINWGSGTSGLDTNLYRQSAGVLRTDGQFITTGQLSVGGASVLGSTVYINDSINVDGNTPYLSKQGALALSTNSSFRVSGGVLLDIAGAGNRLYFGAAADASLYRSAANTLKTDGVFNAVGGLQINGVPISGGARGQNTVTFSGAPTSAQLTFAHGLGVTPTNIQLTSKSGIAYCLLYVVSADATNITVEGRDSADAARTGTNGFYWVASP